MPLEATIDTLEGLSEEVADLYTEKDGGGYQLKILENYVPADKVEDVGGLKSALRKERENVSKLTGKLKSFEEKFGGVDLEEYQTLREQQEAQAEAEAERKGEWEKLKEQMRTKHTEAMEAKDKEIARRTAELERHLIDAEVVAAINGENGNVELLKPHVRSLVRLVEEDGVFQPRVVDHSGTPRVDADGNPLSIKALVSEMRDQDTFKSAFKGSGQQGGGTPPADGGEGNQNASGGGKPPMQIEGLRRSKMTPREKVDFINEHGNDKYMSLPM